MTRKICWFFDFIGIAGAGLLLVGLYLAMGLATLLMAAGVLLLGWALWMSYLFSEDDHDDPD